MVADSEIGKLLKEYFLCDSYNSKEINNGKVSIYGKDSKVTLIKDCQSLPVQFDIVAGDFIIVNNFLTTLVGSPYRVGRNFLCHNNKLTSLVGCPKKADEFNCSGNLLQNLDDGPKITRNFFCEKNHLTSLENSPTATNYFVIDNNKLKNLNHLPDNILHVSAYKNSFTSLEGLPKNIIQFEFSWRANLGVLRLIPSETICIINRKEVSNIIKKYQHKHPIKQAILDAQKELIELGYLGNAKW